MTAVMPHTVAMFLIGGLVVLGMLVGLGLVLWSSLRDRYVRREIDRDEIKARRRDRAA
ncbi:MAG TPA: hypothetical protein VE932_16820 [Patescibacteria group bacterium]|nr:hypothetical protein [Patescibacteria group bacterium]